MYIGSVKSLRKGIPLGDNLSEKGGIVVFGGKSKRIIWKDKVYLVKMGLFTPSQCEGTVDTVPLQVF